ncbi:hypothetical protein N0B51_14705 [Tsuneonella sp. YG55]|uniref:Uncharacterized protein n=1 Tax=Tsuneonella litorea TaxID=2976475 RepID=A0A9X2W6E8_9SPHN|nr:hypothetical protein [Tsuneonella litorea]MCT2560231.1 hypothetical protein [Tsuneonella litorea]
MANILILVAVACLLWLLVRWNGGGEGAATKDNPWQDPADLTAANAARREGLVDPSIPNNSSSPSVSTGIRHDRPPMRSQLADPTIREAYDAEAHTGDFVTPPNFSVESE